MICSDIRRRIVSAVVIVGTAMLIVAPVGQAGDVPQRLIDSGREQFTRVRKVQATSPDSQLIVQRTFNGRSCAECHKLGGIGGAGPTASNVQLNNGSVLPRFGTSPTHAAERDAILERIAPVRPRVVTDRTAPAESRSETTIVCGFGCGPRFSLEEVNTPALFGLGLIDSISQESLDSIAAAQPDGLRGRSPQLRNGRRGRFGSKAQIATLAEFNENACAAELGLTTARFPVAQEAAFRKRTPETWNLKSAAPAAPKVDMSAGDLAALNAFVATLPRPVEYVTVNERNDVAEGKRLFVGIGCAECHVSNVGGVAGIYSDLLLHKIGTVSLGGYGIRPRGGVGSDIEVVGAEEIRTPPLWGVADSAPYLHDGSAPTLKAAILRHAEQAGWSAEAFARRITEQQRDQVIAFLESLRAPHVAAAR